MGARTWNRAPPGSHPWLGTHRHTTLRPTKVRPNNHRTLDAPGLLSGTGQPWSEDAVGVPYPDTPYPLCGGLPAWKGVSAVVLDASDMIPHVAQELPASPSMRAPRTIPPLG